MHLHNLLFPILRRYSKMVRERQRLDMQEFRPTFSVLQTLRPSAGRCEMRSFQLEPDDV